MITRDFALAYARDWIEAWNAHDLDRILWLYTQDFEMRSPVIAQLMNEPSGMLRGQGAIRPYWSKALAQHPELRFELVDVLVGTDTVTVLYRGHRGLCAEVFWFNAEGKAYRAAAHYGAR